MTTPLVSVIAPAHNAAQFFDTWVASIGAQLYEPLEVVLVDDGCTDGIAGRASAGPVWLRYLRQDQRGPAAARNAGIRASTGELIAFLDLDDLWAQGHLRRAAQALEQHPEAGIAQGLIRNVLTGADGRLRGGRGSCRAGSAWARQEPRPPDPSVEIGQGCRLFRVDRFGAISRSRGYRSPGYRFRVILRRVFCRKAR